MSLGMLPASDSIPIPGDYVNSNFMWEALFAKKLSFYFGGVPKIVKIVLIWSV